MLNLRSVAGLETLTVNGTYTRYAIHDDLPTVGLKDRKKCFNIDVNLYHGVYNAAWGAGQHGNQIAEFECCNFYLDKNQKAWSSHNNQNVTKPSRISFKNCTFKNEGSWQGLGLSSLGNGTTALTYVSIENCHIANGIRCREEDAQLFGGGMFYQINGFGNNIGNSDVVIEVSDSVDYSSRINLVKYVIDNN